MIDKIEVKSDTNVKSVEDNERTLVKISQKVADVLVQGNKEMKKLLRKEISTQLSTLPDDKQLSSK